MKPLIALAAALALVAGPAIAGPGSACKASTQECLDHLAKDLSGRGWVGIKMEPTEAGMKLRDVVAGSPAEKAGLEVGDVLVSVNGIAYDGMTDQDREKLHELMKPGNTLTHSILRGGADETVRVVLGSMPEEMRVTMIGHHMMEHVTGATDRAAGFTDLPVEKVAKMIAGGKAVAVDANRPEFRATNGTLPKAILLSSASDYDVAKVLPKDKETALVFYCANQHCTACEHAAARAAKAGYSNVNVMRAGIMGWKEAGQATQPVPQT